MFTATLQFTSHESAKAFGKSWAMYSRRGYTLGAKDAQGGASLTLNGVTDDDRAWIDAEVARMNS